MDCPLGGSPAQYPSLAVGGKVLAVAEYILHLLQSLLPLRLVLLATIYLLVLPTAVPI